MWPMETRNVRKAETREKILAAGRELLLKEGFECVLDAEARGEGELHGDRDLFALPR